MTDIVTPPTIDALPAAPLPTDSPEAFDSKAFATFAAQVPMVPQINASNAATKQNATAANERATAAANWAGAASDSAVLAGQKATVATDAALSAVNAPGAQATSTTSLTIGVGAKMLAIQTGKAFAVGQTVTIARTSAPGTTRMVGVVTAHDATAGSLTVAIDQVAGAGTFTDWTISLSGPAGRAGADGTSAITGRLSKTAAYTVLAADKAKLIDCSGTWQLGLTAAVTLGDGWYCWLRDVGTGTITVKANGAELIDGANTGTLRGTILITCDGAAFSAVKIGPPTTLQLLTSGTSWTAPLGVRSVEVEAVGGGQAGDVGTMSDRPAKGGHAGGTAKALLPVTPSTAYPYVIGAAGGATANPGGGAGATGAAGGTTSITVGGTTVQATGGSNSGPGTGSGGAVGIAGGRGYVTISGQYSTSIGGGSTLGTGGVNEDASGYGAGGAGIYSYSSYSYAGRPGAILLRY